MLEVKMADRSFFQLPNNPMNATGSVNLVYLWWDEERSIQSSA